MTPRHFGETHIMLSWRILVYNIVYIYQVEFSVFIIKRVEQNLAALVPTILHMFLIQICCQQTQSLLFDVYCWALVQPQLYSTVSYENIIQIGQNSVLTTVPFDNYIVFFSNCKLLFVFSSSDTSERCNIKLLNLIYYCQFLVSSYQLNSHLLLTFDLVSFFPLCLKRIIAEI